MASAVNFFQPGTEAAIDANQIMRQREMAALLMKQSQQTPQGQMVNGHYIAPSWMEGVSNGVRGIGSLLLNKQSDQRERAMAEALRARNVGESNAFMEAMQGSPGKAIQPLTPNDDEGNPMPVAQSAATPPDRSKALALALQSQNPQIQAMGGDLMKRQLDAAEFQQALQAAGGGAPAAGGDASTGGAAPPPAGPAAGSNTFGLDPAAFAMAASPNARAQGLAKMIQEANKPQSVAPGGTMWSQGRGPMFTAPMAEPGIQVRNNPDGTQAAAPVANYGAVKAAQEGAIAQAREAAKDQFATPTAVPLAGGPRMLTPAQQREMAAGGGGGVGFTGNPMVDAVMGTESGGNPGAVSPKGAMGTMQTMPGTLTAPGFGVQPAQNKSPQEQQRVGVEYLDAMKKRYNDPALALVAYNWGPDNADKWIANGADFRKLPKETQEYVGKVLLQNGVNSTRGAGAGRGGQGGPGIPLQSDAEKKYETERAGDFAKSAADIQKAARQAGTTVRNLDSLEQLFKDPNVAQGGAAEGISNLKNLAASAGVDVKGVGAEQAIESITNKMALDARSTADGGGMPGAMSDADRNFLKAQTPGLSKTPEGRTLIIATSRALAERQQQVARMATDYERENGKIDAGFDRVLQDFANKNQMFDKMKAATPAAPASDFRTLAAQELARRQKKTGGQ